jgi:hypothetical protein
VRVNHRLVIASLTVLAAGLILGLALPALADERDIAIGGVWIWRVTHDASGYTSYQRATEVRKRITEVLSIPDYRSGAAAVEVQQKGKTITISVGSTLVFTVVPEDTIGEPVAPYVTPLELAQWLAKRLSDGLSRAFPDPTLHIF